MVVLPLPAEDSPVLPDPPQPAAMTAKMRSALNHFIFFI